MLPTWCFPIQLPVSHPPLHVLLPQLHDTREVSPSLPRSPRCVDRPQAAPLVCQRQASPRAQCAQPAKEAPASASLWGEGGSLASLTVRLSPDILPGSSLPLPHGRNPVPDASARRGPPAWVLTVTPCHEGSRSPRSSDLLPQRPSGPQSQGAHRISHPCLRFPCPLHLACYVFILGQHP